MKGIRTIIGYAISDPEGRYPETPEFGVGCLDEARAEARDLIFDFEEELGEGRYGVITFFAGAAAEHDRR